MCAWVTMGGSEKLEDRCAVRPTSETLFCEHYANIIHSWRDLPKLYNQWCSVLRWEKTSRPFLRHREFLWQEGHTMHATAEEAREETMRMLNIYADFMENVLAMPVIKGRKTDKEKFNGAEETYTVECMMHDHKALQAGTSHYFGDGFAKAFDITFTGKDNQPHYPHQTSWGVSTRMIGGIIMTHGDDNGLVLPPRIAPAQAVVIPVAAHKPGVLEAAASLRDRLNAAGVRSKMDDSDNSPGWKFAEYEMKGVPVRVEIGPKDMEKEQCVIARRDTGEKITVALAELESAVKALLDHIHDNLYAMALKNREDNTFDIQDSRGGQGHRGGEGRLPPVQVVRQSGVRAGHEGAGRRQLPLHAPGPERHRGRLPRVRQEMHHRHLLGRGLLRTKREEGNAPSSLFQQSGRAETDGFPPKFRKNWKKFQPSKKIFIFS